MIINDEEFFEDSVTPRSPSYQWAADSSKVIRSLQARVVDEQDRFRKAQALVGYNIMRSEDVGAVTRRWIHRTLPASYPAVETEVNPDSDNYLFCTSIPAGEPIDNTRDVDANDQPVATYRYRCEFNSLFYNLFVDNDVLAQQGPLSAGTPPGAEAKPDEGDCLRRGWANTRFISKFVKRATRIVTLRNGILLFVEADANKRVPVPEGFPFTQFRNSIRYIWHNVPIDAVPEAAIASCSNCVNSVEFDGRQVDTLLFVDNDVIQHRGPLGDRLCDITYEFLWQPNVDHLGVQYGWVGVPRVRESEFIYQLVSADGDPATAADANKRPYKRADFTSLFRPPQG